MNISTTAVKTPMIIISRTRALSFYFYVTGEGNKHKRSVWCDAVWERPPSRQGLLQERKQSVISIQTSVSIQTFKLLYVHVQYVGLSQFSKDHAIQVPLLGVKVHWCDSKHIVTMNSIVNMNWQRRNWGLGWGLFVCKPRRTRQMEGWGTHQWSEFQHNEFISWKPVSHHYRPIVRNERDMQRGTRNWCGWFCKGKAVKTRTVTRNDIKHCRK